MERVGEYMEKIITLEEKINLGIDLLEVVKTYCEFNYDKSEAISAINSVLKIVLETQKEVANLLDGLVEI